MVRGNPGPPFDQGFALAGRKSSELPGTLYQHAQAAGQGEVESIGQANRTGMGIEQCRQPAQAGTVGGRGHDDAVHRGPGRRGQAGPVPVNQFRIQHGLGDLWRQAWSRSAVRDEVSPSNNESRFQISGIPSVSDRASLLSKHLERSSACESGTTAAASRASSFSGHQPNESRHQPVLGNRRNHVALITRVSRDRQFHTCLLILGCRQQEDTSSQGDGSP